MERCIQTTTSVTQRKTLLIVIEWFMRQNYTNWLWRLFLNHKSREKKQSEHGSRWKRDGEKANCIIVTLSLTIACGHVNCVMSAGGKKTQLFFHLRRRVSSSSFFALISIDAWRKMRMKNKRRVRHWKKQELSSFLRTRFPIQHWKLMLINWA